MKAIIADIDDTICPSTRPIRPEMAREIERIIRAGKQFAFISGSTIDQIYRQVTPFLTQTHHLLGASGSHYVEVEIKNGRATRKLVHQKGFTPEQRGEILGAFEDLIRDKKLKPLTSKLDQLQDRGSQITLSALGRHAPEARKRSYDPKGTLRKGWLRYLQPRLGKKYVLRIGGTSSVDVTPAGIDKAWGIRMFLQHIGVRPDQALFLGDKLGPEGNDYPALQVVDGIQVKDSAQALEFLRGFMPSRP